MDQFEILEIFESYTVKLSEVERELGMPAKFLSRYKNPKYKLPEKWIKPLTEVAESADLEAEEEAEENED